MAHRFSASIPTAISISGCGNTTIFFPRRARAGARVSSNCGRSSDGFAPTSTRERRSYSYVAIRSDEPHREGLTATHPNLRVVLPLRERGIDKKGVIDLLDAAGVGLPDYYRWRSRSGCTFCFFQQKIEWVNLMREHPQAFEEAKRYEKNALEHGSPFTWSDRESLDELADPKRVEQIEREHRHGSIA